jgi:hypothetical protein
MEALMALVTGDVVANPGGELPYKVVFKKGESVICEWEVESQEEGEEEIVEFLREAFEDWEDDEDDD